LVRRLVPRLRWSLRSIRRTEKHDVSVERSSLRGEQLAVSAEKPVFRLSACQVGALSALRNPAFVGEPSSECCNFHGDSATGTRM
jgi:hypothetical protein